MVIPGGAYRKGGKRIHFAEVLLLLLGLCVKMNEIGVSQMEKIIIKLSVISTTYT